MRAEAGDRDDAKDLGDGELFENGLVVTGRELPAVAVERAFLGGTRGDALWEESVRAHREIFRVSGAAVALALHQRAEVGHRRRCIRRDAAGGRDGVLGDLDL